VVASQLLVDSAAWVMILLRARGVDNSQQVPQSRVDLVAAALHRSSASAARQVFINEVNDVLIEIRNGKTPSS
jgi:hypothetical protein